MARIRQTAIRVFQCLSVKGKRRLIAVCYHAGIAVLCLGMARLGMAVGSDALVEVSGAILLGDILTFRVIPVSRRLQEALIPEAVCYGCGTVIELVGIFRCGCGFVSHKERHVFSPCPMCGKYYLWAICSVCETSIPV